MTTCVLVIPAMPELPEMFFRVFVPLLLGPWEGG